MMSSGVNRRIFYSSLGAARVGNVFCILHMNTYHSLVSVFKEGCGVEVLLSPESSRILAVAGP